VTPFASPRRLGVAVSGVLSKAADRAVQQKLMPVAVALTPTASPRPRCSRSWRPWARMPPCCRSSSAARRQGRGPVPRQPGARRAAAEGLQKALDEAIAKLPIPKVMTYQLADGWSDVKFVRPAHRLVALHGEHVVHVQALGLTPAARRRATASRPPRRWSRWTMPTAMPASCASRAR
jgi:glycyl-tRNA synthetase beta chain